MVKFFISQLIFMILTASINTFSSAIKPIEGLRRVRMPAQGVILEWIKKSDSLVIDPRAYLKYLNTIRGVINPGGEAGKVVYYPGIGPHGEFLDFILPLITREFPTCQGGGESKVPRSGSGEARTARYHRCKAVEVHLLLIVTWLLA